MPEGDTIFLAAQRLNSALAGRTVTRSDFRVPRFATSDLSGHAVRDVVSRGKHLLFRFNGDLTLHTHQEMDGSWHLYRPGERWRGPSHQVRAVIETNPWHAVGFRVPVLELIRTSEEAGAVGHLGPDPLGPDWDAAEALRRLTAEPELPIGDLLLDQRVIAGPGNVYRCEICFLRGVSPWMPLRDVADPAAVVDLTKRLMDANRTTGDQITTGDPRRGRKHWVYARAGEPCRRCGTPIRRLDAERWHGGRRSTYWCPSCQPGPVPAA